VPDPALPPLLALLRRSTGAAAEVRERVRALLDADLADVVPEPALDPSRPPRPA
jgi:hypothetical protein